MNGLEHLLNSMLSALSNKLPIIFERFLVLTKYIGSVMSVIVFCKVIKGVFLFIQAYFKKYLQTHPALPHYINKLYFMNLHDSVALHESLSIVFRDKYGNIKEARTV
jgi:hypothetical protein